MRIKLHRKVFQALTINNNRCYECHLILRHVRKDGTIDLDELPRFPLNLLSHLQSLYKALDLDFPLQEAVAM